MIPLHPPTPHPLGIHALAIATVVLTRLNYQVADPRDPALPVDLLASRDSELGTWFKVQVKQCDKEGWVSLRRGDKRRGCMRYVSGDFEYLVATT